MCTVKFKVELHPFEDGNGRTSRLLMDYMLHSSNLPPIFVPSDPGHRSGYYSVLAKSGRGAKRSFILFIIRLLNDSLKVVHLKSLCSPSISLKKNSNQQNQQKRKFGNRMQPCYLLMAALKTANICQQCTVIVRRFAVFSVPCKGRDY